jgi:hypothetical protein
MPNVFWSADVTDVERSFMERFVAFMMSVSSNMAPFSMAFVSGALDGAVRAGYTPPGLLSEDELMFVKKGIMLPNARTYRLSSSIMKVFYPPKVDSSDFGGKVFIPKLERWFVGWIEVHAYMLQWMLSSCGCRGCCGLPDHPPVQYPCRTAGVLFLTVLRMYCAFCLPTNALPNAIINWLVWRYYWAAPEWMQADSWIEYFLIIQTVMFICSFTCTFFQMARIQCRLYDKFQDCLKFNICSLPIIILGTPILMVLPIRLLWCYFIHGIKNKPVVHTANTDGFDKSGAPTAAATTAATTSFMVPQASAELDGLRAGSIRPGSMSPASPTVGQMESASNVLAMNSSYFVPTEEIEVASAIRKIEIATLPRQGDRARTFHMAGDRSGDRESAELSASDRGKAMSMPLRQNTA